MKLNGPKTIPIIESVAVCPSSQVTVISAINIPYPINLSDSPYIELPGSNSSIIKWALLLQITFPAILRPEYETLCTVALPLFSTMKESDNRDNLV